MYSGTSTSKRSQGVRDDELAPLRRNAASKLASLAAALDVTYGSPEATLRNKANPVDEAVYIILSFQTNLARCAVTWSRLRRQFPTWREVEQAPLRGIVAALRDGGLHRQKARTIKRLLLGIRGLFGDLTLEPLRGMSNDEAERILTSLPGISWKAARCIMLYSLDRNVLPVDVNTFRVLKRVGVLQPNAVYRRRSLHDALQAAVPAGLRRRFHVNLVVHGQRTCLPVAPKCPSCPVRSVCRMAGVRLNPREPELHVRKA